MCGMVPVVSVETLDFCIEVGQLLQASNCFIVHLLIQARWIVDIEFQIGDGSMGRDDTERLVRRNGKPGWRSEQCLAELVQSISAYYILTEFLSSLRGLLDGVRLQFPLQALEDVRLGGLAAVSFETESVHTDGIESVFHDIERSLFLIHEQDCLASRQLLSDDIGDRLALARPGGPLDDDALAPFCRLDGCLLTRVGIEDLVDIFGIDLLVDGRRSNYFDPPSAIWSGSVLSSSAWMRGPSRISWRFS